MDLNGGEGIYLEGGVEFWLEQPPTHWTQKTVAGLPSVSTTFMSARLDAPATINADPPNMPHQCMTSASMDSFDWPKPLLNFGAQRLLTSTDGVTHSGYLNKKGGVQMSFRNWPLRYVVVHRGCLYYFKNSSSNQPRGAFSLRGYNRVLRARDEETPEILFPFKLVHSKAKSRTWLFSAANENERKIWMAVVKGEIEKYCQPKSERRDYIDSSFYDEIEQPLPCSQNSDTDESSDHDYLEPDEFCILNDTLSSQESDLSHAPSPDAVNQDMHRISSLETSQSNRITMALPEPWNSKIQQHSIPLTPDVCRPPSTNLILEIRNAVSMRMDHMKDIQTPTFDASSRVIPPNVPLSRVPPVLPPSVILKQPKPHNSVKPKPPAHKPKIPLDNDDFKLPQMLSMECQLQPRKTALMPQHMKSPRSRESPEGQSFKRESKERDTEDECTQLNEKMLKSIMMNTTSSDIVEQQMHSVTMVNGLFCIRNSATQKTQVLVVWDEEYNKVRNFKLFQHGSSLALDEGGTWFPNLLELLQFYEKNVLPLQKNHLHLTRPLILPR